MPALELITGFVTAPSTTLTAATLAAGNSLTIRNTPEGADIRLISLWSDHQTADSCRLRSPLMHDNVQGFRWEPIASQLDPIIPFGLYQKLIPQDTLILELSGSATAGDIESACLLIYYSDLPGVSARLIDTAELMQRMQHILTVQNTLTLGTAGGYSGDEALNAEFDNFKGNTDYAIVGYLSAPETTCIRYRSSDFGNLGIGGPGNDLDAVTTANWFKTLSDQVGVPLIPVFNSANLANVLIDGAQDENGTDVTVSTILAQLAP